MCRCQIEPGLVSSSLSRLFYRNPQRSAGCVAIEQRSPWLRCGVQSDSFSEKKKRPRRKTAGALDLTGVRGWGLGAPRQRMNNAPELEPFQEDIEKF